jgi:hypothetical protein
LGGRGCGTTASNGNSIFHELPGGARSHLVTDHSDCLIQLPGDFLAGTLTTQHGVCDQHVMGNVPGVLFFATGVPLIAIQQDLPSDGGDVANRNDRFI